MTLVAAVSLLRSWDRSWSLVLAHALRGRALRSQTHQSPTLVLSGGDVWKKGGEHRAGKGRSNTKRNQMENMGKTEDVLAGKVETSRLDGGMVKKLEQVQSSF